MQIVIDIPDRIYKIIQNKTLNIMDAEILEKAVKNGILLPKEHGRLIDADRLLVHKMYGTFGKADYKTEAVYVDDIDDAPTIIEADKEVENEKM